MASNTVLRISNAKRGAQSDSKMATLPQSSVRAASAASLQGLKTEARRCHTPKQFRELLEHLRAFIPFQKFIGLWGYPSRTTIRFIFNQGFPGPARYGPVRCFTNGFGQSEQTYGAMP